MNVFVKAASIAAVAGVLSFPVISHVAAADTGTTPATSTSEPQMRKHMWANLTQAQRDQMMQQFQAEHQKIQAAIDAGDYQTWVTLLTQNGKHPPIVDTITADKFSKYVEAQKLMEQAHTILDQLGVKKEGFGFGGHRHGNDGDPDDAQQSTTMPPVSSTQ